MLIEEGSISRDKICECLWADKTTEKARRNLSNALCKVKKILPLDVSSEGTVSVADGIEIECDTEMLNRAESLDWDELDKLCKPFMDIAEAENWPAFGEWLIAKRRLYHDMLVKALKKRAQLLLAGTSEDRFDEAIRCYEKLSEFEPYDERIHGELVRLYIKTDRKVKAVNAARAFSGRIESDFGIDSDLSDISSLMKRNTESISLPKSAEDGESPMARNDEIMRMLEFLSGAGNGHSLCGMVWGEQGIGKTHFIEEITSCLKEQGWECFYVDCWQEEKSYPLAPLMRLIKSLYISTSRPDDIKSISELNYSYIADLIYRRISCVAGESRKLLVIENIQWMDDASWNILESIMSDNSAERHLLVSGIEEIRSAFMLRTALADEPFKKFEITLRRFSLEETGRICREMAPGEEWTDADFESVYEQTEGNPFFIKELLKYRKGYKIEEEEEPERKNAYLSMIELLDEEERIFLEAMAVCPEEASMKEIAKVLDISPLKVSVLYNNLRLHGFLHEQESDGGDVLYYFTHTKIREALLSGMSLSRKTALHIKNIEVLEESTPAALSYRNRKIYARIWHHCREAKLPAKELYWRIKELEVHIMAVHEVFPTMVDQDLMHYIPTVEDVNYTEEAISEALAILDRILRTEGGSPETLKMMRDLYTVKGAHLWWSGKYEEAECMLRDAIRRAIAIGEPEPIIKAGAQMCYLAIQRDDAKRLLFCGKKLYRYAKKTGFRQWEATALRFIGISHILNGRHDEVEKYLMRSITIFEKLEEIGENYTVCMTTAEHFLGDLELARGNTAAALSRYENCINVGESIALFRGLGLSLAKAALCLIILGRDEEAEKYLRRMANICSIMHTDWEDGLQGGGIAFSLMALINCRKGEWRKAGMCITVANKIVRHTERPVWQAVLCWSKMKMCEMSDSLPEGFKNAVLDKCRDDYKKHLDALCAKIGWKPPA